MTFASLGIIVVEDVEVSIPGGADEIVLLLLTPVDQTRDVLILLLDLTALSSSHSFSLTVRWFLETLLLNSIFDIKTVGATSLVADEELTLAVIQADAGDVSS